MNARVLYQGSRAVTVIILYQDYLAHTEIVREHSSVVLGCDKAQSAIVLAPAEVDDAVCKAMI